MPFKQNTDPLQPGIRLWDYLQRDYCIVTTVGVNYCIVRYSGGFERTIPNALFRFLVLSGVMAVHSGVDA